jgi:hypothetical protein
MNRQDIINIVESSSLQRWEGLRKRADGSLLPLPNDDTLAAQRAGLERHLARCAPVFNEAAQRYGAPDLALAYVARQARPEGLGGCHNYLLNSPERVSGTVHSMEADILCDYAEALDKDPEDFEDDSYYLAGAFRGVAAVLRELSRPVPDPLYLNPDLLGWLVAANRQFYLDTAVQAALAADRLAEGTEDRALGLTLAANAVGNNLDRAMKEAPDLTREIMAPLDAHPALCARVKDPELYQASLQIARAAAPSCG